MAKNDHNRPENPPSREWGLNMRIAQLIVAGSVAALALTAPALAKNSESQKSEDKTTSTSCHAYQQAADGSWTALPCQEAGGVHTEHKQAAKGGEEGQR
jgi:hypothetical protein